MICLLGRLAQNLFNRFYRRSILAGIVASVVNKRDVNGGDDEGKKGQEYISL